MDPARARAKLTADLTSSSDFVFDQGRRCHGDGADVGETGVLASPNPRYLWYCCACGAVHRDVVLAVHRDARHTLSCDSTASSEAYRHAQPRRGCPDRAATEVRLRTNMVCLHAANARNTETYAALVTLVSLCGTCKLGTAVLHVGS